MDRDDKATALRSAADADDRRAEEMAEQNPTYADYLTRRADHCRRLARDEEDATRGD